MAQGGGILQLQYCFCDQEDGFMYESLQPGGALTVGFYGIIKYSLS